MFFLMNNIPGLVNNKNRYKNLSVISLTICFNILEFKNFFLRMVYVYYQSPLWPGVLKFNILIYGNKRAYSDITLSIETGAKAPLWTL